MSEQDLVDRLWDEADLCRNDGAEDIAILLSDAAKAIVKLREDAAAEIVAYLRDQANAGDRALLQAVTGSRLERDLAAGVVALRRAAQGIERLGQVLPLSQGEG